MSIIFIDARVSGYKGNPVRLIGACKPDTGRIKISLLKDYQDQENDRDENRVIVTDSPSHFPIWHQCFYEQNDLREVIQVYQEKKRGGLVDWDHGFDKFNPDNVMQPRKLDEGGLAWEFESDRVENGHVAILLCVWISAKVSLNHIITEQLDPDSDNQILDDDDPSLPYSIW